jgi:hypothetical protein
MPDLATPHCMNDQQCAGLPHATGTCKAGVCAIAFCDLNYDDCDKIVANGCESDALTDVANCNFCGVSCQNVAHGTGACQAGTCAIASCDPGYANCDGMFMSGCATPTGTDPLNCGGCGLVCSIPNAMQSCVNGKCVLGLCEPGFADCDNNPQNGCEVSLLSDAANCNQCGMACPMNLPSCMNGVCSLDDFPPVYLLYLLESN